MDRITLGILVAGLFVVTTDAPLNAQQRQKRPVTYTYTYRSTAVVRTQWSPGTPAATSTTTTSTQGSPSYEGPSGSPSTATPAAPPTTEKASGGNSQPVQGLPVVMNGSQADQGQNDDRPRPTLQQMQNASGSFNLSHNSFTQNAYFSPNNYLGSQYNSWNNLQPQQFDGFNRTQPEMYFNSYSYVGATNNQWSNLSSGSLSANELGGWTYWP